MAKPIMSQACCCCGDLRIGTMVLLTLFAICNVYMLISSCVGLSNFQPPNPNASHNANTANHNDPSHQINQYLQSKEILITQLIWTIINSVIIALGLYGVFEKKHRFILPWILFEAVGCALVIIAVLVLTIILSFAIPVGFIFLILFVAAIPLAIFGYMWCVVYSYYAVLQEENSRGLYDKQPYRR